MYSPSSPGISLLQQVGHPGNLHNNRDWFGGVVGINPTAVIIIGKSDHPRFIPWSRFRVVAKHHIIQHLAGQVVRPEDGVVVLLEPVLQKAKSPGSCPV